MDAIKLSFWYGEPGADSYDRQVEVYVSGPMAAAGHIFDALALLDGSVPNIPLAKIEIDPNSEVPTQLATKVP